MACSSDDDAIQGENPNEEEVVPVEIADGELSEILQETLNVSSADEITEERMAQITTLNLSNSIVADLSGLETATNLEVLLARDVDIADLTPLSDLTNLKEIDMRNANMDSQTDLSFLANLNSLEKIDFQNTAVEDISVLSGKNTLLHINLRETNVTDISALENMVQLQFLNLNRAGGGNGIDNPEIIIPMENLY